ncbi:MAG: hypothetical protein H0W45_11145, partial [Acidobacteria bacterium]|nr:hypothetical protein [Acidobacteriota bacterium]
QANILRRQAAKTRRYKILREDFRRVLRQTFAAEGKRLTELVDDLEAKLEAAQKTERAAFWEVAEKDDAFREATRKAREAEENLTQLRARHSENALERDRNEREKQYKTEQITNLKQRSAALQSEVETVENRFKLLKSEIERLKKDEQAERSRAEKSELDLRDAENKYQLKLEELGKIEKILETERAEVLRHTAAFERLTEIERQLENAGERLKERLEGLRREGKRAEETFAEHQKEAEKLGKTLEKERRKLENLHGEKQGILEESGAARNVLQSSEKVLGDLREEFSRKMHRLETLQELEERKTIYAPTVQKLFAEQKRIGVKFLGTLADELNVDKKAEKAVENLFGNYLQTVLVESEEEARKTIRYLNENNLGRVSILVQSSKFKVQSSKSKAENRKSQIAKFLGVSDEFAELLQRVFPREMTAQLVENLEKSKAKDDETFVSFDGDLNFGGKLFVGGKTNVNEKNASLLAFKRELRELGRATEKLSKEATKAEKEAAKAREILIEKENKLVDLQSFIVKVERELLSIEIGAKSLVQETERAERHKKVVGEETKQIQTELLETERKRTEAKVNAGKAEKARSAASENLTEISQKLNEARNELNAENVVLNEKKTFAATSIERQRSALNALRRVETEEKELESRLARQNSEITETDEKAKDLEKSIAEIDGKIAFFAVEQKGEQDELSENTAHLKLARDAADAMSAELAELNKKSAEVRNERAALEIR